MLNHPSVAACLHIQPGTRHTNATKLREASTMQQFGGNKYNSNTCEKRDHSQDIGQRLTVRQQTSLLASAIYLFF